MDSVRPIIIQECTCGRKKRDIDDYAVIWEQFGKGPSGRPTKNSLVVCMRKGCIGSLRTGHPYVAKLPKIWYNDYLRLKKKELELDPGI